MLDLQYAGHRILPGKPAIGGGLPATYAEADDEADTLEIDLVDAPSGVGVTLSYTLFARLAGRRALDARSRTAARGRDGALCDERDAGPPGRRLDAGPALRHLGARASVVERALVPGRQAIGSLRGGSGAEHNPFLALRRADHDRGDRRGLGRALVYSGNFLAEVDVDPFATARLRIGIHPEASPGASSPGRPSPRPRPSSPGRTTASAA